MRPQDFYLSNQHNIRALCSQARLAGVRDLDFQQWLCCLDATLVVWEVSNVDVGLMGGLCLL